jgi:hypothetical protein
LDQLKADLLVALVIGWAKATKRVPDAFLKDHHIGCGENSAHCGEKSAHNENSAQDHAGDSGGDAPPDDSAGAGGCVPSVGFGEVGQVGDLFSALAPRDDSGTDLADGASGVVDADLGLVLPAGVGVVVNVVMTDLALFGIADDPAQVFGLGPVPAGVGREMVAVARGRGEASLRRLYTDPGSGALVAMESKSRVFPDGLGRMLSLRDGQCRFPYCDAPIRQLDHVHPHAVGGATGYVNGQGLCTRHNLVKDADGATSCPTDGTGGGAIVTRLAGGAEFVSPARRFPVTTPESLDRGQYWQGYRAGRADQKTLMAEKEQHLKDEELQLVAEQERAHALSEDLNRLEQALTARAASMVREQQTLAAGRETLDDDIA